MNSSLDESLFFAFSKEKGLARKTFDKVFGILDTEFDSVKKLLKRDFYFSPHSLNKASILIYDKSLDDEQNSLHFLLLAFLFQAEKFSQPSIAVNKLIDFLNVPLGFWENLSPFYFRDNFDLPIIFSLDSLYFQKYYESEKKLTSLIYPFLKKSLSESQNSLEKVLLNKLTLIESSSVEEDCNLIEELFKKQTVCKFLLLFPSESSYLRLKNILKIHDFESKLFSEISYSFRFKKGFLEDEFDGYTILVYDAHLFDLFDFELLLGYFSNAEKLILMGNSNEHFYLSKYIFSQIFQLSSISLEVSSKSQNLNIKHFLEQWKKNNLEVSAYQKNEITQIKEGFHFVNYRLLDDLEGFLWEWSKKFKDQNSIIISPFKTFSLNKMVRDFYEFDEDEVQQGEPIIFSQNFVDSDIFKGYFTYYQKKWENYKDSFQTAYVISPNLAINNEWNHVCFLYTVDLMENFDISSMVFSILSKTKKSFTFVGKEGSLQNFNCKNSLGSSNLIKRLKV